MTPDSIRALAGLIEVHLSVRAALVAWPPDCEPEDRVAVMEIAALVTLGVPTQDACRSVLGDEGEALTAVLTRGERQGGHVSAALIAAAARMEELDAESRAAAAASGGVRLSVWVVLAVPTIWVVVDLMRNGRFHPGALSVAVVGGTLALMGLSWIARLRPRSPSREVEDLAASLAHGLAGGASLDDLFRALAEDHPVLLEVAARRVAAGLRWSTALAASEDPTVAQLGRLCSSSLRYGRPLVPALHAFAARLGEARRLGYERKLRRAPVRMVVPLTTCVLPGCLLMASSSFLT